MTAVRFLFAPSAVIDRRYRNKKYARFSCGLRFYFGAGLPGKIARG
jgi:hypothetical protein